MVALARPISPFYLLWHNIADFFFLIDTSMKLLLHISIVYLATKLICKFVILCEIRENKNISLELCKPRTPRTV